jgi:putative ABC transport system permease protein
MVTCWAITPAVAASVIALPAGMTLQSTIMRALASDQASLPPTLGTPPGSVVHVYTAAGLTQLALAGLALTIAGALGPATWAATSRTTVALHAE